MDLAGKDGVLWRVTRTSVRSIALLRGAGFAVASSSTHLSSNHLRQLRLAAIASPAR